jgi:ATPase family AAA domain-containing protein 2
VPLLFDTLERVKEVIGKVLPVTKKLTALEEAEWEEESEEGALEREMMNQCSCFLPYFTL